MICHAPLFPAEIKNGWRYASTPLIRPNDINRDKCILHLTGGGARVASREDRPTPAYRLAAPMNSRLADLQKRSGGFRNTENIFILPGVEPKFAVRQASGSITIKTELFA
jgi:hypothetical protein